ncbi:MAG: hypothetical protein ACPG4W_01460 [Flavobacteriales bacterium]
MKTLLLSLSLICSLSAFAGWPGVCEIITYSYHFSATTNPNVYNMEVVITNTSDSENLSAYCDIYETPTAGVTFVGTPSCYPSLNAGETKTIEFEVHTTNPEPEYFDLDFKIKDAVNGDTEYCKERTRYYLGNSISVEELETEELSFDTKYYDITGRKIHTPTTGLYIEKRIYENGEIRTKKVYFKQ